MSGVATNEGNGQANRRSEIASHIEFSFLKWILGAVAVGYIALYVAVAISRMAYPFEMEWMEGGSLVNVHRILNGEKLYVEPTISYIPFFYTPLYYYLAAGLSAVMGETFVPLRLISFFASLGCMALIYLHVFRRGAGHFASLLAVGFFAGAFKTCGAWYDLGRADSLFLFLTLGAIHVADECKSKHVQLLAAIIGAAAYFTKQTALPILIVHFLADFILYRKPKLIYAATLAALILAGTVALDYAHDGWYGYYTRKLMMGQTFGYGFILYFWTWDLLPHAPIALAATIYLITRMRNSGRTQEYYSTLLLGMGIIGVAWLTRVNIGGYKNVLMPAFAFLAWQFGLGLSQAQCDFAGRPARLRFLYGACLLQFALLMFHPMKLIPTTADREAGEYFVQLLKKYPGEVVMTNHPYLLERAGKPTCAHTAGMDDVMRGDPERYKSEIRPAMRGKLERSEYAAAILEREWNFERDVKKLYRLDRQVFDDPKVFWPMTGWRTRPEFIYIPKNPKRD